MRQVGPDGSPEDEGDPPDVAARAFLYTAPVVVAIISLWRDWRLTDPASLSGASALMAGILFAAFTQLATLRERLEDRDEPISATTRKHFRETAAHLMMGSLTAATEAAFLVVASGSRNHPDDKLAELPTAIALGLGAYLFLLFVMAVRRMYSAYLRVFEGGLYLRKPQRKGHEDQDR
ncbi:hypothetical protein ACQSSU_13255 [Micromonospora echinospora]